MTAFVMCAIGTNFRWQAGLCAKSIKLQMPDARILVYTDKAFECPHVDEQKILKVDESFQPPIKATKVLKLMAIRDAPFERFAYIDCDAFVATPLYDAFDALSTADISGALDTWRFFHPDDHLRPPINTGVLFIHRSREAQAFLEEWPNAYLSSPAIPDQWTFRELFYGASLHTRILPQEMNARCNEVIHLSGTARIIHRPYNSRWHSFPSALAYFLNTSTQNRIFNPRTGLMNIMANDGSTSVVSVLDYEKQMAENLKNFLAL